MDNLIMEQQKVDKIKNNNEKYKMSASAPIPSSVNCGNEVVKIEEILGYGRYGQVYRGCNTSTGKDVAVKFEEFSFGGFQLIKETKVYKFLKNDKGFAKLHWSGRISGYYVMVIDLLGVTLEDLFCFCDRKFSRKTLLMLMDQFLSRVEVLHGKNYVHRDLKPENFLIGSTPKDYDKVYLTDFGLAKRFRDPKTKVHNPSRKDNYLIGTCPFMPTNVHSRGAQLSPRDDLESIGYIIVYLSKGCLPWSKVTAETSFQKYNKIKELKMSTSLADLCSSLPNEFIQYMEYCRKLEYDQVPNYTSLRWLFQTLFKDLGYQDDGGYDWILLIKELREKGEDRVRGVY